MSLESKKILGISITVSPKHKILEEIQKYFYHSAKKPLVIATPNPEQIVLAKHDSRFAKLLNQADVAIPDGVGLAWAAGVPRIAGVEFMEDLVRLAVKRGVSIGLIGGWAGVAIEALECLKRRYPGLVGWAEEPGDYNGYNNYNFFNCYKKINKTNTRLVFVGLGAPKQEIFIEQLLRLTSYVLRPSVFMSVGGAFDTIAGRVRRAPRLVRTVGLEWLWRLVRQPWRLRRQLALCKFLWMVLFPSS